VARQETVRMRHSGETRNRDHRCSGETCPRPPSSPRLYTEPRPEVLMHGNGGAKWRRRWRSDDGARRHMTRARATMAPAAARLLLHACCCTPAAARLLLHAFLLLYTNLPAYLAPVYFGGIKASKRGIKKHTAMAAVCRKARATWQPSFLCHPSKRGVRIGQGGLYRARVYGLGVSVCRTARGSRLAGCRTARASDWLV
jgi:hypothetical protein